jgi:hypothetical protein
MASRTVRRSLAVEAWPPRLSLRPMDLAERMGVPLSPPPHIGTRCRASAISSARTPAVDPGARRRAIGAALASVREGRWQRPSLLRRRSARRRETAKTENLPTVGDYVRPCG